MIYFQFERILGRCAPAANDESEVDVAINISVAGARATLLLCDHTGAGAPLAFSPQIPASRDRAAAIAADTRTAPSPPDNLLIRLRGRPLLGAAGVCQSFNYYQLLAGTITGAH